MTELLQNSNIISVKGAKRGTDPRQGGFHAAGNRLPGDAPP